MNRLKQLCNEKGIQQKELARIVGRTPSAVSGWATGKFEIDNNSLFILAEFFGVSVDYILGRSDNPSGDIKKKGVKIPVLGNVAAGLPIDAIEDVIDYEEIPEDMAKTGQFFGLKIKGDSMFPDIKNGDVVIVKQQEDVENGNIAIVLVNGDSATCKKVMKREDGLVLVANNPAVYEPHFYTNSDVISLPVQIIGRVVELRRTF